RAHGSSGGRRGGRDRRARRQVGRAAARGGRAPRGRVCDRRRAAGVPRAAVREVVAARPDRVRPRDPEDERRQVPQDGAARAVRGPGCRGHRDLRALVTGGRGGIGAAIVAALGETETAVLDLPEFDVGEPEAWRSLEGEFDAAFLNAGTGSGCPDVAALTDEEWNRILRANLGGVVYGTRELAARLMPSGGSV